MLAWADDRRDVILSYIEGVPKRTSSFAFGREVSRKKPMSGA